MSLDRVTEAVAPFVDDVADLKPAYFAISGVRKSNIEELAIGVSILNELKLEWFDFMAQALLPSSSFRKLEKSALDAWLGKFEALNKRADGPISVCGLYC